MPDETRDRPSRSRLAGLGFNFAGSVAGFTLLGYWIGQHYEKGRVGVLIGAVLGLIGGTYNLVRDVLITIHDEEAGSKKKRGDEP